VADVAARKVERLVGDPGGVREAGPRGEGGVAREQRRPVVLLHPYLVVLVAQEVAGEVRRLQGDGAGAGESGDDAELRVGEWRDVRLDLGAVLPVPDEPVGVVVPGQPDRGEAVGGRDADVGRPVSLSVDLLDAGAAVGAVERGTADVLVAAVVVDEDVRH
jgi:hypothetical protein